MKFNKEQISILIGTILGVILGLLFSYNIENIRQFLEKLSGIKIFDPAIYSLAGALVDVKSGKVMFCKDCNRKSRATTRSPDTNRRANRLVGKRCHEPEG